MLTRLTGGSRKVEVSTEGHRKNVFVSQGTAFLATEQAGHHPWRFFAFLAARTLRGIAEVSDKIHPSRKCRTCVSCSTVERILLLPKTKRIR